MAAKAVSELSGKEILYKHFNNIPEFRDVLSTPRMVRLHEDDNFADKVLEVFGDEFAAICNKKVVIKPDQLIKRRGANHLVYLGTLSDAEIWFNMMKGREITIDNVTGTLRTFIVEPLVMHEPEDEMYVAIISNRKSDVILFCAQGGIHVGDVDSKAKRLEIPVKSNGEDSHVNLEEAKKLVAELIDDNKIARVACFIKELYEVYREASFTYMEINPLVLTPNDELHILDLAAKIDETAGFLSADKWTSRQGLPVEFPPPFGRDLLKEEKFIAELDAKTGASLKLTILNKNGRIWTMVAGGGASVVFTDTVCDLGGTAELANYGEYSGDPSEAQTFLYAKTLLSLMTEGEPRSDGKVLLIGGSIANFTNVARTFAGIVKAIEAFATQLKRHSVTIFVRRGGPNYKEGLRLIRETGERFKLPIFVYGPETHMTEIVKKALTGSANTDEAFDSEAVSAKIHFESSDITVSLKSEIETSVDAAHHRSETPSSDYHSPGRAADSENEQDKKSASQAPEPVSSEALLFDSNTSAIVWGQQSKAVQSMLDFDYVSSRQKPSVVATTYPFTGDCKNKFYFGREEILIPSYSSMVDAFAQHPEATVLINFASMRSVYATTCEALSKVSQIKTIAIIAEGVPEAQTRKIIALANEKKVTLIGPATVGGVKPGCFKIGNTGGMIDNIVAARLYRPGSVAYVSKSGGMSNELNNIINRNSNGVYEGLAIGGDRYPGSSFINHIQRYAMDPNVALIVMLGEVGGTDEYEVVRALKNNEIQKPLIAWCIGTCADHIKSEVQFGHAGACASGKAESAAAKNAALKEAGAIVPSSFNNLGGAINKVFNDLLKRGKVAIRPEVDPPAVPIDYNWARELGLVRKPASFLTSICDERGEELLYAGIPISNVLQSNMGIGGVLSLLWFQRELPAYGARFLEMCLMLTADHGPAVSGAHNTIVCARAGKDLVSSLVSGLLTIGDRFGGALDGAARQFSDAFDHLLSPQQFVNEMRVNNRLIMGIGHRVKSINNPDSRVEILKQFLLSDCFAQETPILKYALEVEKITVAKKPNLILNVDGIIGVAMVDLLRYSSVFSEKEARDIIAAGALNGLFVLGRSIGFIGHYLDQRRLKQGLYRHPWDDISYVLPERTEHSH